VAPVGVSASVVLPAIAVIFPPGRTVQVFAVAAAGAAAPALAIKAAVAASTTVPTPVRTGPPFAGRFTNATGRGSKMRWLVRQDIGRRG